MSNQALASNDNPQTLTDKAQACLEQAVEVPGAPLYHMGNIAIFNSKSSFELMQSTIDYLTCKAKIKIPFTTKEKAFLIELYETFWWGGIAKGMPEAGKLANHYVNGKGKAVQMDATPYQKSVVVQDTIKAMKLYIKELASKNGYFFTLKTGDLKLIHSQHFKKLMLINSSRNIDSQGYVKSNGVIFSEADNQRLKYADNRFILNANTTKLSKDKFQTWWSVNNRYDFEPFEKSDKYSELPLKENKILKLPDGLSKYMDTGLKIAKPFDYVAKWNEIWG
jgi:hypothetical protein